MVHRVNNNSKGNTTMRIKDIDGLPVIDATAPIILKVQSRDIKGSNTKTPDQCAIARACRRQLHVKEARIHLSRMYLRTNDTNWVRYIVPKSARSEIIAFDRGGNFEPSEFKFDKVTPSQIIGQKRSKGKRINEKPKIRKPHVVTNVRGGPA
jgi:hypothetical protein